MKILITGITGFVGSHLADYLLENHPQAEVHGTRRWRSRTENIDHLRDKVQLHECDINDPHNTDELIKSVRPEKIFHLAAQSFVPASWESPAETFRINVIGQANLFESVRKAGIDPVILIAGSSEEYGQVNEDEIPIKENSPLRPLSPYAVSKAAQDLMGYQYFKSYGLRIIRTRAFNHSGPRRGDVFVDSDFAKQIARIETGQSQPEIRVGNLESVRDFTDVRDIVRAYLLATEKCEPGEVYNIASGRGVKIADILKRLIALSAAKNIQVKTDQERMRPSDVPVLIGDSTKFKNTTGWQPEISYLDQTLPDTLNYWRERI